MEQDNFSPEQSLKVIQSMIEKAKHNLAEDSFYLLLWGWLVLVSALAEYVLMVMVKYEQHYLVWNLMWVGAIVSIIYAIKKGKKARVKTQLGETMKFVGIGTGITFTVFSFIVGAYEMWQHAFPFYFAVYGLITFISGRILDYLPLRIGGGVCWVIAVAAVFAGFDIQLLLMALAVIASYLVPGYLLKNSRNI